MSHEFFSNKKEKRKQDHLLEVTHFLIFCEGECTEPEYFKGFSKDIKKSAIYKDSVKIETQGPGMNTISLVKYADKYIKDHGIKNAKVWCVFDKDSFSPINFDNAIKMCASRKYECAWSNQCIEYWFILHFDYYESDNNRKYYFDFLNKKYKEICGKKYEKNNEENYNILKEFGCPKMAIKFAKKRNKSGKYNIPSRFAPSTQVYRLVEQLAQYLPNDVKNKFI